MLQGDVRKADPPLSPTGEIILYQTEDGRTRLECRFAEESIWLSQPLMADLFQKDVRTINEHLRNIYAEGEIEPGGNHPEIPDRSPRGYPRRGARGRALQPGRHPRGGLSRARRSPDAD